MFFVSFSLVPIEINKRKEERALWRQKKLASYFGLTVQVYGTSGIVAPVEHYNAGGSHGGDFLGPNRPLKSAYNAFALFCSVFAAKRGHPKQFQAITCATTARCKVPLSVC